VKLRSWTEIGSDGDVLLTPYVPKGNNRRWWWWWPSLQVPHSKTFPATRAIYCVIIFK